MTDIDTPAGTARVEVERPAGPVRATLVLGHGAGGGIEAPDLLVVRDAALAAGVCVARVLQPYRVAGRRTPPAAPRLDEAWLAVVPRVRVPGVPLVVGGRSSGARVACRTAAALGADGVLALAFPLYPPARGGGRNLERSRAGELPVGIPTLVVGGDRDPFGVPDPAPGREVVVLPGARHDLRRDVATAGRAVVDWMGRNGWI